MQQVVERLQGVRRLGGRARVVERIVPPDRQRSLPPPRPAPRLERPDAAERGARRPRRPEGEHLVQPLGVERPLHFAAREQRLDLGREVQVPVPLGVVQRQDPEAIAGEEQRRGTTIVQREGELAVEPLEQPLAPLLVAVNQHLGVAARAEHVTAHLELVPQLEVIVDLAVVDHADVPVLVRHRLRAAGDIDHAQPHVREADPVVRVQAEPIGPTMPDRGRHALEQLGRYAARPLAGDACQAAHQPCPPD